MQFGRGDSVRTAFANHGLPSASRDGHLWPLGIAACPMRQAKSYSIVDHALLHGGYLARISHLALVLYLFLVVVGDKDGRSYYSDQSICDILRLSPSELATARSELIGAGLIAYRAPNWWVKSLSSPAGALPPPAPGHVAFPRPSREPSPICGAVPEALKAIIRSLEERT